MFDVVFLDFFSVSATFFTLVFCLPKLDKTIYQYFLFLQYAAHVKFTNTFILYTAKIVFYKNK